MIRWEVDGDNLHCLRWDIFIIIVRIYFQFLGFQVFSFAVFRYHTCKIQTYQNYYQIRLRWEQFIKEIDQLLPEISELLSNWLKFLFHCCSLKDRLRCDVLAKSSIFPKKSVFLLCIFEIRLNIPTGTETPSPMILSAFSPK